MTTTSKGALISTIYDRLLIDDDTEESVSGSDFHLAAILALYDVLLRYAQRTIRHWYVTAEVMVLVDVPDRTRNPWTPMPDVYVVLDTPDIPRTSLDTRVEGQSFPQFICEVASESAWGEDVGEKRRLYADLGTREYIVFDPTAQFLHEHIRAWRRAHDGSWEVWAPTGDGFLDSGVLGLRLRVEGTLLRVYDPVEGLLPTGRELDELVRERAAQLVESERVAREQAIQLAESERVAREQAARIAKLEARLAPPQRDQ